MSIVQQKTSKSAGISKDEADRITKEIETNPRGMRYVEMLQTIFRRASPAVMNTRAKIVMKEYKKFVSPRIYHPESMLKFKVPRDIAKKIADDERSGKKLTADELQAQVFGVLHHPINIAGRGERRLLVAMAKQDKDILEQMDPGGAKPVLWTCLIDQDPFKKTTREIVRHFPHTVTHAYGEGLYEGENLLHIAIVQQNFKLAEFLLTIPTTKLAADKDERPEYIETQLAARATGPFFLPLDENDQKSPDAYVNFVKMLPRMMAGSTPWVKCKCYYGETPFCFAVCTNQANIAKLLLKSAADTAWRRVEGQREAWLQRVVEIEASLKILVTQDSYGNTALHLATLYNLPDMYDYVEGQWKSLVAELESIKKQHWDFDQHFDEAQFSLEGALSTTYLKDIANTSGNTPLNLASKFGLEDMFNFLLPKNGTILWVYGRHMCKMYPVKHLEVRADLNPEPRKTRAAAKVEKAKRELKKFTDENPEDRMEALVAAEKRKAQASTAASTQAQARGDAAATPRGSDSAYRGKTSPSPRGRAGRTSSSGAPRCPICTLPMPCGKPNHPTTAPLDAAVSTSPAQASVETKIRQFRPTLSPRQKEDKKKAMDDLLENKHLITQWTKLKEQLEQAKQVEQAEQFAEKTKVEETAKEPKKTKKDDTPTPRRKGALEHIVDEDNLKLLNNHIIKQFVEMRWSVRTSFMHCD
eukprot:SAG11_NODE_338_length_10535_cov_8.199885_2_plen_699_part_00